MSDSPKEILPGDIVLTHYGAGVVTKLRDPDEIIQVRLWRTPYKSIASTSVAFLRKDGIVKFLEAAPGMIVNAMLEESEISGEEDTKETNVMVHSYSPYSDTYTVSIIPKSNDEGYEIVEKEEKSGPLKLITVPSSQLKKAKSSKFYPLVEDLMKRADQAMSLTSTYVSKSSLSTLINKSTEMIENATSTSTNTLTQEKIESVKSGIALPDQQQIMQIYSMMKDEELTVLLKKGQERLKQLVSDEIPKTMETALQKSGIEIAKSNSSVSSYLSRKNMEASREKALNALNDLLSQKSGTNMEEIKASLGTQFSTVFDSLSTAARSDQTLNSIFNTISEKTSEWQEATGRIKATKSASLFIESSQRLKARAANLLSPEQRKTAKGTGMRLSKAFMEGDAAIARLKSIELGDQLRSRLVKMIEMRSGSEGGLDGIIAGALTSINAKASDTMSEDNIQMMLFNLQQTASSSTKKAHETLLGTLSRQSQFREAAILRIEEVLVSMENQIGSDISAVDIAKIARGEGGTSALFEPIARRAAKEIENQLDTLEGKLTDETSRSVLAKTRDIISGNLTVSSLLDEAVNVLNDEKVVAHGEKLVKYGESVLDALEKGSTTKNKMVGDVIQIVEKAGLSKDSLMRNVEKLDVGKILDTAETAVTNEQARKEMLSSAADSALEFLLKILPSMPVPPFDGVKDGLVYHLSNLSMKGFKVKKENIIVEIAGIRATKQAESPTNSGYDSDSESDLNTDFSNHSLDRSSGNRTNENKTNGNNTVETQPKAIKATEILVIDVQNISAVLEDAVWSFEQTFFPYLKGNGQSFVDLSEGSIRLQFELRKRRVASKVGEHQEFEPVLCLHKLSCSIGQIKLKLLGSGKVVWIINKIASYLKGPLRDYVVRTILDLLKRKSGLLLKTLNDSLSNFWGIILKTSKLNIDDLTEISESDLVDAVPDKRANEVELVWREHLPLGLNLLMNDESGLLKVVDFPRGSQARKCAIERKLDPEVFNGSTIIKVNGTRYNASSQQDLVDALRDPGRPKSVSFELANAADAERIQSFIRGFGSEGNLNETSPLDKEKEDQVFSLEKVNILDEGPLGIRFSTTSDGFCLRVDEFLKGENGQSLLAENIDNISVGDILFSINDVYVFGEDGRDRALKQFELFSSIRPLSLTFSRPYLHLAAIIKDPYDKDDEKNPSQELCFEERKLESGSNQIFLKEFTNVSGVVESSGVFLGDRLVRVNNFSVGGGGSADGVDSSPSLEDIFSYLEESKSFPASLTFARPSKDRSRWDSSKFELENAETVTVAVDSIDDLGCQFGHGVEAGDIIVTSFKDVAGKFQKTLLAEYGKRGLINMVVQSVNGQVVPSYANTNMVSNAIYTSWRNHERVEILFREEERKIWLDGMAKSKE